MLKKKLNSTNTLNTVSHNKEVKYGYLMIFKINYDKIETK